MDYLHDLFLEINNQLLFITNEEELEIVTKHILQWQPTSDMIALLPSIIQYYNHKGFFSLWRWFVAIVKFNESFLCSEFAQSIPISSPLSFICSIIFFILTNPHSFRFPCLTPLLKRIHQDSFINPTNSYSIIYFSLVSVCLFIQSDCDWQQCRVHY